MVKLRRQGLNKGFHSYQLNQWPSQLTAVSEIQLNRSCAPCARDISASLHVKAIGWCKRDLILIARLRLVLNKASWLFRLS